MKKIYTLFIIILLLLIVFLLIKVYYNSAINNKGPEPPIINLIGSKEIRNGDIIFQTSLSEQSKAIQLATNSKYSHCGIIFKKNNEDKNWYVIEAVQPVKWTLLDKWIARGKGGHYVIKRLITDPMLPEEMLLDVRKNAEKHLGKNYDLTFEWNDKKIYCSELIYKAYKDATNIEICELEKLKDFNLKNNIVKAKLKERYGNNIPLEENVVSPKAIFESKNLITTIEN
jgi:hypothetical protein